MGLKSFLAKQASNPSGWFGKILAGRILNKDNASLEDMGLELMDIKPDSTILEIGFGNGRLISKMGTRLNTGKITGIEISKEMIMEAEKKNKILISSGKVELYESSVNIIPTEDEVFDKIFTANTIYFWPNPESNIQEIKRTLKTGGKFYCAFRPEDELNAKNVIRSNRTIFKHLFSKESIRTFLEQSGFKDVIIHEQKGKPLSNLIAVGTNN
jgi:SAM-dependent methyltransferase